MSTITQNKTEQERRSESSVVSRYSSMKSDDFDQETQQEWEVIDSVRNIVSKHVSNGSIRPIDAKRALAAFTANLLGYEELVPRSSSNSSSMIDQLYAGLSGSSSMNK